MISSAGEIMIAKDRLAEWLSRLVQIPSVAPDQAGPRSGTPGEARLAGEIARWFGEYGGEVHTQEVFPDRPNVYGLWRGRTDRWAAVDAHMDTVGVEQMTDDPFSGRIQNGRVYGRGAVDTKATLAVVLATLEAMHQAGHMPKPNLLIAATADGLLVSVMWDDEGTGATGTNCGTDPNVDLTCYSLMVAP